MSRPIRSYPEHQRAAVIKRRDLSQTRGLGYWSAVDALRKIASARHKAERERAEKEAA